jgi:hypothetical protein
MMLLCIWCSKVIEYSSGGLKCFISHTQSAQHVNAEKAVRDILNLYSFNGGINEENHQKTIDLNTRIETTLCLLLAEHSLPAALKLLELTKAAGKDIKALHSVNMCRTTSAYKMKFGLAKTLKKELMEYLKNNFFFKRR